MYVATEIYLKGKSEKDIRPRRGLFKHLVLN